MRQAKSLLLFAILLFFISCSHKGEDSIYLIPENYEGNLLIVFNQQEGEETLYENKERIYHFGTSGILKTKFQSNYGIQNNFYFYLDSLGTRTRLRYLLPSELKDTDEVVILNKETGNDFDTTHKIKKHFELFTVGKQSNSDSIGNLRSKFMWEMLK